MEIRNKLYPYPVLSELTNDYVNSSFTMEFSASSGLKEINLSIKLKLNNNGIERLVKDKLAEYVIHIECPYTSYREVICTDDLQIYKNIPEHRLNGKVYVCAFILAKKELTGYTNDCFCSDYKGTSFDLERGSIIAIGGEEIFDVQKEVEELNKIPSIFTICKRPDNSDETMRINLDGAEKITISLSNQGFVRYKQLLSNPIMEPVMHSMLIVPTLVYVFEKLKQDGIDNYEDRKWYKSIERSLRKCFDNSTLADLLEQFPSFELAQKSINQPINRAFDLLIAHNGLDDEEE